jgi:hypothetical protein
VDEWKPLPGARLHAPRRDPGSPQGRGATPPLFSSTSKQQQQQRYLSGITQAGELERRIKGGACIGHRAPPPPPPPTRTVVGDCGGVTQAARFTTQGTSGRRENPGCTQSVWAHPCREERQRCGPLRALAVQPRVPLAPHAHAYSGAGGGLVASYRCFGGCARRCGRRRVTGAPAGLL